MSIRKDCTGSAKEIILSVFNVRSIHIGPVVLNDIILNKFKGKYR